MRFARLDAAGAIALRLVLSALAFAGQAGCTRLVREADLFQAHPGAQAPADARRASLRAEDGTRLAALRVGSPDASVRLLYLYGNAEDAAASVGRLRILAEAFAAEVVCVDYRGYGASGGAPGLAACCADTTSIADALVADGRPLLVYGRSIGSGMAVWLAAHRAVAGLVLEAPPSDIPSVIAGWNHDLLRWWQRLFVTLRADPALARPDLQPIHWMAQVRCPVVILHGTADVVIPPRHGQALYDATTSPAKRLLALRGRGHNDIVLTPELVAAIRTALSPGGGMRAEPSLR